MIKCYKNINDRHDGGGTWVSVRTYDSGDMEEDIIWTCTWLLAKNINKVFLEIDGEYFKLYETKNINEWRRILMKKFHIETPKTILEFTDEEFLL